LGAVLTTVTKHTVPLFHFAKMRNNLLNNEADRTIWHTSLILSKFMYSTGPSLTILFDLDNCLSGLCV